MIFLDKITRIGRMFARLQVVDCFTRTGTIPLFSIDLMWQPGRKGIVLTIPWVAIGVWYSNN